MSEEPNKFLKSDVRSSENENTIAIVRLQETMKNVDFRLDGLEDKFDKLENSINSRFDKMEVDAEVRRKDLIESQKKLYDMIQAVLEQTKKTNGRVNRLEEHKETVCQGCQKDLKDIKTFKWQVYGAGVLIVFFLSIWGVELIKFFSK